MKVRVWDNIRQTHIEYEAPEPEPMPPPTEAELEAQYKARTKDLIHEQYDGDREKGLMNDAILATLAGLPVPESYLAFAEYRESCKDKAHMEVYGYAR